MGPKVNILGFIISAIHKLSCSITLIHTSDLFCVSAERSDLLSFVSTDQVIPAQSSALWQSIVHHKMDHFFLKFGAIFNVDRHSLRDLMFLKATSATTPNF